MSTDQTHILLTKLDEFIRKYYKNQLVKGLIYSLSIIVSLFILTSVTEYYAYFGTMARTFLFFILIASNGFIITRYIIIPLLKLNKIGEIISYKEAADIVGKHFFEIQDKLLNVLQLQSESSNKDNALLNAAINQKINELKPVPFSSAIDIGKNKKYLKYAIIPLSVLLFILSFYPAVLTESATRIVNFNTNFTKPAPFKFSISNKNLVANQFEDFEVKIKVSGNEIPEMAYIQLDNAEYRLTKEDKNTYSFIFKNIQSSKQFRLAADGFFSQPYEVEVSPKASFLNFSIQLNYPAYTGKTPEVINAAGEYSVPAGTSAKINLTSQNTVKLNLSTFNQESKKEQELMPSSPNKFFYETRFFKTSNLNFQTLSTKNKLSDSVSFSFNVIPDAFPKIQADETQDSSSKKIIYFNGNIEDDYGFSGLRFKYRLSKSKEENADMTYKTVPMKFSSNITKDRFYYMWDLNPIQLKPGDEIEYFFEVSDNDRINGSKTSASAKNVYKAPTNSELAKAADKANNEVKNDLRNSIDKAKKIQKDLAQLQKKMIEKKTLNWEDKKQFDEILNQQQQLEKEIENIKQENQRNQQQQSEFNPNDEKISEKQKEIDRLFDEVFSDETKELLKQMEKMMQQVDKEKIQEMVDKMKLDNKDVEKELDRTLELFKQLEFEQKFETTKNQLKELAEKQKELAKESEKLKDEKNKTEEIKKTEEKQAELNKEFEDVKKQLDDLEKKNSELENPNKMDKMEEKQKEASQQQQQSSEQLKQNKPKKASQSQKSAGEKMEEMAQSMQQQQEQMEQEENAEDAEALRQILENLLQLSFSQEELMTKFKNVNTGNPQYVSLTKQQKKLKDDAKMIEDSLFALSKRNPKIASVVNKEISAINENMSKAIQNLADRQTPVAASRQQYVMTSVNNLALILSESLKQMKAQSESKNSKPGNGSCKKPGGTGQPKMGDLKKMQQKLSQQMKEGMGKGQKPGEKGSMSKELAKMAAQQEAIRNEVQKAMQNAQKGKDGKGGDESGGNGGNAKNLKEIAKKMEENETDLVNKRITQETLKRQQEILTRLLEAEKAEREREQDEKRQSNEAKNANFSNPNMFKEYNMLKQREAELLRTVPPNLTPFYKNKVSEYLNNVSESGTTK